MLNAATMLRKCNHLTKICRIKKTRDVMYYHLYYHCSLNYFYLSLALKVNIYDLEYRQKLPFSIGKGIILLNITPMKLD